MDESTRVAGLYIGNTKGLMSDMDSAVRWPASLIADVKVAYHGGPPDQMRLRIEPCAAPTRVAITRGDAGHEFESLQLVRWDELPGSVLSARCFAVLAVHWFGDVEMVPRVVGTPLWAMLSIELRVDGAEAQSLQLQLQSAGQDAATLRCRADRNHPWITRTVLLNATDADPLRALVRHGLDYVRPTLLQQPQARSREPDDDAPLPAMCFVPPRFPLHEVRP